MADESARGRVFLSYSRKDLAAAESLRDALIARGFDAYLDIHDIAPGEPWRERLGGLILSAEKLIFLISPDSVASEICDWEVNEAERLGKSVTPVVIRETAAEKIPPRLSRLNFAFLRDEAERSDALAKIATALTVDLAWEREKTRINDLAEAWARADKPRRLLITRNDAIAAAERWRDTAPKTAPAPTETQRAFIAESRRAYGHRIRQIASGSAFAALAMLALAVFAYWQSEVARENEAKAEANAEEAREQRDTALRGQSWFLADLSDQAVGGGDDGSGVLLALAGLPDENLGDAGARPYTHEPASSLISALIKLREIQVFSGHSNEVVSVAFSPDGTRILTGSLDGTARLWSLAGEELQIFHGHSREVVSVAFSPDGSRILTGSDDSTARLWSLEGKTLQVFSGRSRVASVAFSPYGTRILTGSGDGTAQLWSLDGEALQSFEGHSLVVGSVAFSPDGSRILTGSDDRTARLWSLEGEALQVFRGHSRAVVSVAFNPFGTRILTGSANGTARLWSLEGEALQVFSGHSRAEFSVAFSPYGTHFLTGSRDGAARLSSLDGEAPQVFSGHSSRVGSVAFSPDGTRILTGSGDRTARLWSRAGEALQIFEGDSDWGSSVTFSLDVRRIPMDSRDYMARLWNGRTGQDLVDYAKRIAPRCLTQAQLVETFLPPEPERWCITGPGLEAEPDSTLWEPKWPYQGEEWRDWLLARDRGEEPELPGAE